MPEPQEVRLRSFDNSWYSPGRGRIIRSLWFVTDAAILMNPVLPFGGVRRLVLRLFGAKIGRRVVIKPRVNVKYPWNLEIGDDSWIGEAAWLDSLGKITIGRDVCISQGAYLCTGNHDWSRSSFDLIVKPIMVQEGAWVGAKAVVLGGVTVARNAVITAGSVVVKSTEPDTVYQGNPAKPVKSRWKILDVPT